MKLEVNKIVTLGNDEEYLVVDKVLKDDKEYYYIAQVNDEETDIKDNYKIIKIFLLFFFSLEARIFLIINLHIKREML